jgi:hypothetical protein
MPSAGFEVKIPASERSQTHALDLATTGIGQLKNFDNIKLFVLSRGLNFYCSLYSYCGILNCIVQLAGYY